MKSKEDVVISGIGGYFPKCINKEEFEKLLLENADFLESRWKEGEKGVTNVIGKVPSIQYFDTSYFGIHRQQCIHMDPMQRIMLERTFEALIDAGVNPVDIRGKRVGVFAGSSVGENDNIFYETVVSGFGVTGHSRSMMPNRISYWLNLKGPSSDYDSNWLNGLEVLRLAYESIREGHCDSAIVGTANLVLNAEISWTYNDAKLISPDGITRSFDADANGYGRSDGIVVLYLQRESKAKRSYGTIVHVKTSFNGNRGGPLMSIDQSSFLNFINEFYEESNVDPSDVNYVEAYGCALKNMDEIELNSIEQVYCKNRETPLLIGCVKSNTGHAEATSSMFAIVKLLIAMDSGQIPANSHYKNPNPNIKGLVNGRLKVVDENTAWSGGEYGAVNSFGLASSFGHLLIKRNSKTIKQDVQGSIPKLLVVSTRTEEGIKEILTKMETGSNDTEYAHLVQNIFVKPIPGHLFRGYVLTGDETKQEFEHYPGKKRPVWFVYSGMGSQWPKMATDLLKIPVFAESIKRSHAVLQKKNIDLMNIITTEDSTIFDNILHSFVGIAAIQIALTDILYTLGLTPDGIIGHSVGELGCAYADGCLTAEQMILAAYARGKASLEAELIQGMMAAIGIGYQEIKSQCPPTIEVACHNGPESCTISGPTEDMEKFVTQLKEKGAFAKLVNVSNIAYHSRYIKPAAPLLLKYLKEIIPNALPRSSKWISTSIAEDKWETELAKTSSAEYHTNNLLSSVLFEEGSKFIPKDAIVVEIAPHGLLQAILKRSLPPGCTNIPLTQRGHNNNVNFLLSGLGRMYISGVDNMRISALYPKIDYPVSRGTPSLGSIVRWEHSEEWRTGNEDKLNYLVSVKDVQVALNVEEFKDYIGHDMDGRIVLPPSLYLIILYKILVEDLNKSEDIVFQNVHFHRVLSIPKVGHVPLSAMIQKGTGEFEVISEDQIILSGIVRIAVKGEKVLLDLPDIEISEESLRLSGNDFYQEFYHRGCHYSGLYKSVKSITLSKKGSLAEIKWFNNWAIYLDVMLQQILFHSGERNQEILVPKHIQKLVVSFSNLPVSEEVTTASYNFSTGIIHTNAIQISGIKCAVLEKELKSISYNSVEFVPFHNKIYKSWKNGINSCIQILSLTPEYQGSRSISVVEVQSEDNDIVEMIKTTMSKYKDINATFSKAINPKFIVAPQSDPLLVVYYDKFNSSLAEYLSNSHAFILTRSTENVSSFSHIIEVAQFFIDEDSFSLYRKAVNSTTVVVNVHGDTLSSKDLIKNKSQWELQLKNALENIQPKQRLFLVSNVSPFEGIPNFISDVQKLLQNPASLRFVFVLGKEKKVFDDSKPLFRNVLKQDLLLSVVVDEKIGSYLSVPVEFKESLSQPYYSTGNIISNNQIRYIGINLKDISNNSEKKPEFGCIDYSGVNGSNKRIMGVAHIDKNSYQLTPDSILSWEIPHTLTLEDGATIPFAYSMAYYCLMRGKIKPSDNVLIHSACTPIGFAAISIASSLGCHVYTTTSSDKQKSYILQRFTLLTENDVFSSNNSSFETRILLATKGKGVRLILNNLSGSLLEASLRCLSNYGSFIHIGQHELDNNGSIGLSVFLRYTSFCTASSEALLHAPNDLKKEIQKRVDEDLRNFVARPLNKDVIDEFDPEKVLWELNDNENNRKKVIRIHDKLPLGKLNDTKKTKIICDSKSSYLIIGGNAERWVDMAEWLVQRGAKKIIAATESKPQQAYLARRLTLLRSFYNVDIIHAPFKAHTRDSAIELVSEVCLLGPIHSVFLLPDQSDLVRNSDIKSVQHVDTVLRTSSPKTLIVNMMKEVTGVCQNRSDAGYPTCTIEWQRGLHFSDMLDTLDDLLGYKYPYMSVKSKYLDETSEETNLTLNKKLNHLLPLSIDDLRQEARQALDVPGFYQISSSCPLKTSEVPPVFIIPGLFHQKYVQNLADELISPIYYANYSTKELKIKDISSRLANEMENILPNGPFNIIAVSWGGAVATEVAKALENRGHLTQLYYIDAVPETVQSTLRLLGTNIKRDIALVTRFFNINAEILNKLERLSDWDSRLDFVLTSLENSEENRKLYKKLLSVLRHRIDEILSYSFDHERRISGKIFLLRPTGSSRYDNCGLSKVCDQAISIVIIAGDHVSMLQNKLLANIINERLKC